MIEYRNLVNRILTEGEVRTDRTGVGTKSVFGGRVKFDLRQGFPLVSVKETRWRVAFLEMLFFISGKTNIKWLNDRGSKLWDAWADEDGELGDIYGSQWRKWSFIDYDESSTTCNSVGVIDQIARLIDDIKNNPQSRRLMVSAWNVGELNLMSLPPCHYGFQCYVSNDGHLDMQVNQRSWDVALGAPFNIAQYALLLTLLARTANLTPRRLSFVYGDAHIYLNHIDAMTDVMKRGFIDCKPELLITTTNTDIDGYNIDDFAIKGYDYHPFVKLEVAV
jgi:thymidylate synthase